MAGALAAVALLALPVSAGAQPGAVSHDMARLTLREYAECLVSPGGSRMRNTIDRFLMLSPNSDEGKALGAQIAVPDCLPRRNGDVIVDMLQMSAPLLRGALFRAKFERIYRGKPTPTFAPLSTAINWRLPKEDPYSTLQAFGECVVRTDPGGSRAVIEARVGTPAEDAAFAALMPALQDCLTPQSKIRLSRDVLESLLSESLYQLSVAAPVPAPAADQH